MKIRDLHVENFRVIRSASVRDLPMVAGVWGKNGSGKSALLQAPVVLRNFLRMPGITQNPPAQLNSMGLQLGQVTDVLWKGGAERTQFRIACDLDPRGQAQITWGLSGGPSHSQQEFDPSAVRYFPVQRALGNRVWPVNQPVDSNLGENTGGIHAFVHWFLHKKVREQQLSGKKNEVDRVDEWLTRVGFGRASDREEARFGRGNITALFADPSTGYETPFIDGGFGGVSLAPILFEAYSFRDGILLIEEPELSLHPAAQADVFDFMLEIAKDRGHQVLFTSHSEYLLARFARYAKETGGDDRLIGVFKATKDEGGAHFEREPLSGLVSRFEKQQNLLGDLHTRVP